MLKNFRNNWIYLLIFIFFLSINILTPPILDDWQTPFWFADYMSLKGILTMFTKLPIWFWFHHSGRFFTLPTIMILTYYRWLWNILAAGTLAFIIYIFNFKQKQNKVLGIIFSFFLILNVSNQIRMETFAYANAFISFVFAFVLFILFWLIYFIKSSPNNYLEKARVIGLYIFTFIASTWMENLAVGFSATLFIVNIYFFIKNKKINFNLLGCFLLSFCGLLFLFFSPGMRLSRELYNSQLGIISIFQQSFFTNLKLLIFENKIIFLLLIIISSLFFWQKKFYQKINNKILFITFIVLQVFCLLSLSFQENIFLFFIWFLYLLIFPFCFLNLNFKNKNWFYLFYIYFIFSFIPLLFITQTGARMVAMPLFAIIGIITIIFNNLIFKNKIKLIIYIILFLSIFLKCFSWTNIYLKINQINQNRRSAITRVVETQKNNLWNYDTDVLYLKSYKKDLLLYDGVTRSGEFHYEYFLKYYNLNKETKVIFE